MEHEERKRLRRLVGKHFGVEGLKGLVFDLKHVAYDDLPGDSKTGKILGLIEYLERRDRVDELLQLLVNERPSVDWPGMLAEQRPELHSAPRSVAPEFDRLTIGDDTVQDTVDYLQWMFDNHEQSAARPLPTGFLTSMGGLFRRYTFCVPPEECDTQIWRTRLLAIIETHDVLTTFDKYLFRTGIRYDDAELGVLRANLR